MVESSWCSQIRMLSSMNASWRWWCWWFTVMWTLLLSVVWFLWCSSRCRREFVVRQTVFRRFAALLQFVLNCRTTYGYYNVGFWKSNYLFILRGLYWVILVGWVGWVLGMHEWKLHCLSNFGACALLEGALSHTATQPHPVLPSSSKSKAATACLIARLLDSCSD